MDNLPPVFAALSIEKKLDLQRARYEGRWIEFWSEYISCWLEKSNSTDFRPGYRYRILLRQMVIPWHFIADKYKVAQQRGHLIWFYESLDDMRERSARCHGLDPEDYSGFSLGDEDGSVQERPIE